LGKAKKKKRRALEKLWQTGHYWEWFQALDKENLEDTYPTQWQDAWRLLVKRALRLPERLQDFWKEMEEVKKLPDFPDFWLLFYLRDFVDGKEVTKEISSLHGLSLQAKALQKRALSWHEDRVSEKKLRKLFNIFVNSPEKAGQKVYNDLVLLVQGSYLFEPASTLAKCIGRARKLNYKTTINKGSKGINMRGLRELDSRIEEISSRFPPSLQQVLLYPFVYQINIFFAWLLEKRDMATFAESVSSLPFLFSMTAGEKAEETRNHLFDLDLTPFSKGDHSLLFEKIKDADFEEKVAFLGKTKSLVKDDPQNFIHLFRSLYRDMLSEITRRKENLSPREKKELARVMEEILMRDFSFLTEGMTDMDKLLVKAAEAGCMERRLSVLSLIVSEKVGNKRLRRMAEDTLNSIPTLESVDVLAVLHQFEDLFIPHIGALKSLVDGYEARIPFVSEVTDKIIKKLEFYLLTASMTRGRVGFLSLFTEFPAKESRKEVRILRRELKTFSGYEQFSPIREYIKCFPEDHFTEEGFAELLTKIYKRTNSLDFLIDELQRISKKLGGGADYLDEFFLVSGMTTIFEDQERICLRFLKEHWADLKTATLEKIDSLVKFLIEEDAFSGVHSKLLIRLSNLLEKRIKGGEKEAEPLKEAIMDFLIKSRPKKQRRGRR